MASIKENPASCEVAKEEAEDEFAEEFEEEMEEDLEEDDYEDIEEDDYEDIEEDEYEDIEEEAYEDKEKTQEDEQKLEAKENGAEKEEAKEAEEVKEANEVKEAKEEAKEEEEEVEEEEENEGEEEDDDEDDEEVESSEEESEEEDGVEEAGEKVVAAKDAAEEMIEVQVVKKEEEFVQVLGRPEEKLVMCEQLSASEGTALLPVLQSVTDLAQFHEALSKFLIQWKSLNGYFVSIISAIKALPRHAAPSLEQVKDIPSQPQINFDAASGKSVRKYIENNLDNLAGVRCEVIEALRTHSNPGKLVLQAIGRFYTQKNLHCLPHVNHRRASILLLEFLVLSGRTNDDTSLKEEAYAAALTWRERLITSGLQSATAVDSLGLILFLACYGIPEEFSLKELSILLCKCNMKEKGDVFRRSRILVEKISVIIKMLIKEEMYIEAADLSCGFEVTDTFPPEALLLSFITKVTKVGRKEHEEAKGSIQILRDSDMRQLKALKSVIKCAEKNELDLQELGLESIRQKVLLLEKSILKNNTTLSSSSTQKRKADHLNDSNKLESQSQGPIRSSSESCVDVKEQGFKAQPYFPDSVAPNPSHLAAISDDNGNQLYGWDRTFYDNSAGFRPVGMEHPAMPNMFQPQATAYGNHGVSSGRNLYQFADTVIQHEAQRGIPNKSSNPSSVAAKFLFH